MKSIYLALSLFLALFISSCSSDSSSGNNPFVPGGGTGTTVTFTTTYDANNTQFVFAPNTGVTISKITANCAAANINNEEITGDGTTVWTQAAPAAVSTQGVNVAAGQQWTFKIEGKVGSATGEVYTSNTSITVQ
ncbi:MAG TPA: hypothetical protein PK294_06030 [Ignavibacteria bacterium]|nr:hypothetical protein [Ignavibacteria bacterium]HQY51905.1 hypothetical protein [Ignavibacteria bacterium]HRA99976.1 hypothetical protein [Ignavibacteria bacterium]